MGSQIQTPASSPLYRQVRDILVGRIARGEWRPAQLLPSEPKIALELGVSPGTVRKALDDMAADRLVDRRQGVGTFVASTTDEARLFHFFKLVDAERNRIMPESREIGREVGPASAEERRVLQLAKGERTLRVERLRSTNGRDMMIETVVLPLRRFAALSDGGGALPTTLYDFYEANFGITIRKVSEFVRAVAATARDAEFLGLPPSSPLLEIDRHAFTFDSEPVEWRLSRVDSRTAGYLNIME